MRESVERPYVAGRRDRPGRRDRGARGRRPADRRGGATRALAAHRRVRKRYPCLPARSWRAPRRRSATWRRSAATCCSARAAPISTTMKVRAAISVRRARAATRSVASTASMPSWAPRRLRGDASVRHVRGARRARRGGPSRGPRTEPARCRSSDLHRLPGDRPDIETELEPGDLITAVELPALPIARTLDLPQGARPGELRLRAGLGRGGARDRWMAWSRTCGSRWAAWRTSRGAHARRRRCCRGGPANATAFRAAAEAELADGRAAQRQWLQDRAGQRGRSPPCSRNWRERKHEQHLA